MTSQRCAGHGNRTYNAALRCLSIGTADTVFTMPGFHLFVVALLALAATACGQKGPLVLPDADSDGKTSAASAAMAQPVANKSVANKPAATGSTANEALEARSLGGKPVAGKAISADPAAARPITTKPFNTKQVSTKPLATKPFIIE